MNAAGGRMNRAAWLLASALAWGWTWRYLAIEWTTNEQYQYGLGVPALVLFLAWRRWRGPFEEGRSWRGWTPWVVAGWLVFALGELLRWHDPIWRMTGACLAAGATLVTVAAFYRIGGMALARREAFPILFAWVAVPWPVPCELFLTQNLLHFVTTVTTMVLGLMGIGVLQHGNAIEMSKGMLGIDEACSGIRSLQASLMATLFLGEYFWFSRGRRVRLIVGGLLIAVAMNLARVLTLSLVMYERGSDVATRYHDMAGDAATVATFAGVLGLALLPRRGRAGRAQGETSGGELLSGVDGAVVCGGFAAIPVLVWAWFASMGAAGPAAELRPQWELTYLHLSPAWEMERFEPTAGERKGLRFSTWEGCRLRTPEGWNAQIIHVGWNRGASMPSLAFYHTPELCMPWVGWTETGRPEKMMLPTKLGQIPCVAYRFAQDGSEVTVLQSLSSGGVNGYHLIDPKHVEDRWHRLRTLWQAPTRQVNEELLVYLPSFGGGEAAQAGAAAELLDAVTGR